VSQLNPIENRAAEVPQISSELAIAVPDCLMPNKDREGLCQYGRKLIARGLKEKREASARSESSGWYLKTKF
jgi:hypothetical protein